MIVVGAGPAGSVIASILATKRYRVGLVHRDDSSSDWPELLSPEAVLVLEQSGLLCALDSSCARECRGIMDWIEAEPSVRDFELFHTRPGFFVSRLAFAQSLRKEASRSGVELLTCAQKRAAGLFETSIGPGEVQDLIDEARFVVEASGSLPSIPNVPRQRLFLDSSIGISFQLGGLELPDGFLHLMMLDSGWVYFIPEGAKKTSAVFVTSNAWLRKHRSSLTDAFRQELQRFDLNRELFAGLHSIELKGFRDARTSCRCCFWKDNWMPIGDAAYALNPITGGGLARSFAMATDAAIAIDGYLHGGNCELLSSFVRKQRSDFGYHVESLSNSPYIFRNEKSSAISNHNPFVSSLVQ